MLIRRRQRVVPLPSWRWSRPPASASFFFTLLFLPCFFYLYFINDMLISTILYYLLFFSVDKNIKNHKVPPQNVSHVNFYFSLSAKIIKYTKMPAGCRPQLSAARCGPHPPPPPRYATGTRCKDQVFAVVVCLSYLDTMLLLHTSMLLHNTPQLPATNRVKQNSTRCAIQLRYTQWQGQCTTTAHDALTHR